jgi:hypothetical protein
MPLSCIQEELSYAYLHAIVFYAGYKLKITGRNDYGLDGQISLIVHTKRLGYQEPGLYLDFQVKSTYDFEIRDQQIVYDLDVRNYNLLVEHNSNPLLNRQLLLLYLMPREQVNWVHQNEQSVSLFRCCYYMWLDGPLSSNQHSQRITIPTTNVFSTEWLEEHMTTMARLYNV